MTQLICFEDIKSDKNTLSGSIYWQIDCESNKSQKATSRARDDSKRVINSDKKQSNAKLCVTNAT